MLQTKQEREMTKPTKKVGFSKAIPRAIYYMSPKTGLSSLVRLMLNSQWRSAGRVAEFEEKFAESVGGKFGVATSHARTAFLMILKSLKLEAGSEVLMSPINIPDMVNMIHVLGHIPKFIDYEKNSFLFSIESIEMQITNRTKVLFVTVLSGIKTNIENIRDICKKFNLILILDLTQAYKQQSSNLELVHFADAVIYSLCDLKDIHTHRGGIVVTQNESLQKNLCDIKSDFFVTFKRKVFIKFVLEDLLSSIILRRAFFSIMIYPFLKFLYRINQMENVISLTKGQGFTVFGLNIGRGLWGGGGSQLIHEIPEDLKYRFSELQAQIGLERLGKSPQIINRRKELAHKLSQLIDQRLLIHSKDEGQTFWKFPLYVHDVLAWQKRLLEYGIDAAPSNLPWLPDIEYFKKFDSLAQNDHLVRFVIYIPAHYYLTDEEVVKMAKIINQVHLEFSLPA